ncbi:MAG: glycosyltransferase family 2 protein [Magnetospiraceae bacterium]
MSARIPLSCFLITFNEGDRLDRTLAAVADWVDEIVVVDSGSTDQTLAVAEAHGARVFQREWPGYGPQKRFAEDQCRHDWVLNLDADEEVTPALAAEIQALFSGNGPPLDYYRFRVTTVYPGFDKPRWLAETYNIVRLYKRSVGRYSDSPYWDRVDISGGQGGQLSAIVHHHSVRSLSHKIDKLNRYTDLQVEKGMDKPLPLLVLRFFTELPVAFIRYYVFRRHFTGGLYGIATASVSAFFRWMRIAKILERRRSEKR